MASNMSSPVILRGRARSAARLEAGVLVLELEGVRRRIPVAAIERVETVGSRGRRLVVVLTGGETAGPTTWTLTCRSAHAVHAFAEGLRRALPVRDDTEPQTDGAQLVSEERMPRPDLDWRRLAPRIAGALYGLVLACMAIAAAFGSDRMFLGALCWLFGSLAVPVRHGVRAGWELWREAWGLRCRGILVEGTLVGRYSVPSGESSILQFEYEFTDAQGAVRRHKGADGGPDRVEILYDPLADDASTVGRGTIAMLVFGAFVLLVCLALFTAAVVSGLAALFIALGVL
ncbi:hypothetical protein ACNPQM_39325 [Streptomyces sp. NPDC056231]|uniref:hypothetical protein n=1 Tax=Streptomyces sp. NPDC056231 TaxID=3345755 RepID=UPI003AB05875